MSKFVEIIKYEKPEKRRKDERKGGTATIQNMITTSIHFHLRLPGTRGNACATYLHAEPYHALEFP